MLGFMQDRKVRSGQARDDQKGRGGRAQVWLGINLKYSGAVLGFIVTSFAIGDKNARWFWKFAIVDILGINYIEEKLLIGYLECVLSLLNQ